MITKYLPLLLLSSLVIAEPNFMVDSPNIGFTNYDWKRQALVQGWALVEDNCPDGLATCGRRACCPVDSYCDATENTNSNLCCPSSTPCAYDVSKASRCAVETWVEWLTIKDPICCMPGEVGIQPAADEYYGHCVSQASAAGVPAISLASLASGQTATSAAASSAASSAAAPASTTELVGGETSSQAAASTTSPVGVLPSSSEPVSSQATSTSISSAATSKSSSAKSTPSGTGSPSTGQPISGASEIKLVDVVGLVAMVGGIIAFMALL